MQLRLHNTLTRRKEDFQPLDPIRVRLYVCGPTVYQRIHVGNARAFVVFDVLYRLLRHLYDADHVIYVRNITDIDDKIIDQAAKNGEDIRTLTERTTADFHADLAALGCLPPTHEPRATEHVPGMIALIQMLIEHGHAYAAEGHVLFSVPSMPAYGRLSGRNRDEQIAGARVDVAPYKRDPADFVLWKPSAAGQPGWDSPWGRGRPGWHIECSAMSEAFLAPLPFDIHAGGLDLIFPHHENEIAQSCCARGIDAMAQVWMHNGFLDMRGEKMSKSLGNVLRVPEALTAHPAEAVRRNLIGSHYRSPMDYWESIEHQFNAHDRLYRYLRRAEEVEERPGSPDRAVVDALWDDLNTPAALTRLHDLASDLNHARSSVAKAEVKASLLASGSLLGLLQNDDAWRLHNQRRYVEVGDDFIGDQVARRKEARSTKNFVEADQIRLNLEKFGIVLEDRPDGTTGWRRA